MTTAQFSESRNGLTRLLVGLGLATFIQVLDVSIANVATPRIADSFGISESAGIWLITSFTVANGISILLTGWLARQYGNGRVFIWAASAFCIASLLCGISWNFESLIISRCLQGASAGPILPLSQSILIRHFPSQERVRALSIWSSIAIAAPVFGPLLGGFIVDHFAWQWIFLINLPIGLLVLYLTKDILEPEAIGCQPSPFDICGFALVLAIVCGLQLIAADLIVDLVLPVTGFCIFSLWWIERKAEQPIVNVGILKSRNFFLGVTVISLGYALYYSNLILLPLWLQHSRGLTATVAGLVTAPIGLLPMMLTPFVSRWVERTDKRYWAFLSFISFSLTSFFLGLAGPEVGLGVLSIFRFIQGLALTIFYVPLFAISIGELAEREMSDASVQITFVRYVLAALSAPISLTVATGVPIVPEEMVVATENVPLATTHLQMTDFFMYSAGIYFLLGMSVFFFNNTLPNVKRGRSMA